MESQHRREFNFRASSSSAADAPWRATPLPSVQRQSVPSESSHRHPDPRQSHGYSGLVHDDRFPTVNAVGNNHHDGVEDTPPPVKNNAARGQPQDPQHDDMGYYDMTYDYDHPPPHRYGDQGVADYTGVARDDSTEAQVNPPANDVDALEDAGLHTAVGLTQAFHNEWSHQDPIRNVPATGYLQRVAIHYLHQPDLQVSLIHMEPSHAGGINVVVTLEMTDL